MKSTNNTEKTAAGWLHTYYPLLLIIGYIVCVAFASNLQSTGINWEGWMNTFMAGFFLVFSAFKLLDLPGFATSYATYDLLAQRWHPYGFIYPFIELGLGLSYVVHAQPIVTNIITVLVMGFSSIGVLKALLQKKKIRCACLGTTLNLPMSSITLIEDLLMVIMAIAMLILTK